MKEKEELLKAKDEEETRIKEEMETKEKQLASKVQRGLESYEDCYRTLWLRQRIIKAVGCIHWVCPCLSPLWTPV